MYFANSRVLLTIFLLSAVPYYPGGSMYARNPPMPQEVVSLLKCFTVRGLVLQLIAYSYMLYMLQMHQQLDFGIEDLH